MRPILGLGLVSVLLGAGGVMASPPSYASPVVPTLSVEPSSGPVGSVVTVRAAASCGFDIVFGSASAIANGNEIDGGSVVRYVIPSFVGDPAVAVTRGTFEFAETCPSTSGTLSGITNIDVPFVVTGGSSPTTFVGMASTPDGGGYWLVQGSGGVDSFGDAHLYGSLPGLGVVPAAPITGMVATSDGRGYWLVGADGGVFSFGDAVFHGSLPAMGVRPSDPIVGITATDDDGGYWLAGADGGLFAFGDAPYCRAVGLPAAGPALLSGTLMGNDVTVSIAGYPDSDGYAMVDDGGYGTVDVLDGQTCTAHPNPFRFVGGQFSLPTMVAGLISGIAVAHNGANLWMVGNDGGVFAPSIEPEGTGTSLSVAPFYGSLPSLGIIPDAPIVGISATPDGQGYWLVGADGGVFAFGDAIFHGSAA
jgi:hypothetical protein